MGMRDSILIDESGETWPDHSCALAQRLGYRDPDFDLPAYTVRNLGFIHVRVQESGARVALRAGRFTLVTLTAALYTLLERRPQRIVLAVFSGDDWSYEMFTSLGSFAERTEDLAAGEPVAPRRPWHAAEKDLAALSAPVLTKLRPLVSLWQANRGRLNEELCTALGLCGLLNRAVLVRRPPKSSRLVVEHFGAGIKIMRPCEAFLSIGHDFQDLPDREYGHWAAQTYDDTLRSRRIRLESVRAIIRTSEAATIRVRYDRLLMPWRRSTGDGFVLGVTMLRERSIVA